MPYYSTGGFYIDIWYIVLVIPAILLALFAQIKVSSTFKKYSQVATRSGMTGAQAADEVMRRNGVYGVRIERVAGNLTDHYDPKENVIRLSDSVYDAATVSAVGVAAHEAGHAVQYAQEYGPIKLRAAILPVSRIGSYLSWPLILLGLLLSFEPLVAIGILCFAAVTLFQLITLPAEVNASRRAIEGLTQTGTMDEAEIKGSKKVLSAAALTYLAALAVSLAQLLRLLLAFGGRRRN